MFGLFKRKKRNTVPSLTDLEDNMLVEGDRVIALRYDLGECELVREEGSFYYQSVKSDKKVSWLKMIDASTEKQKVRKLEIS